MIASLLDPTCASAQTTRPATRSAINTLALPDVGCYTGAYIDFGENEDKVTLEAIITFEKQVGKRQAVIASSSYWGEGTFPKRNMEIITRHGAVPLVFWSPWDKPYANQRGPDQFGLQRILEGKCDGYIDMWADAARNHRHPLLVAWGIEMNGDWFPWSGIFYRVPTTQRADGDKVGPEVFRKAYRYVVDRVRARGADNIAWVFHINNLPVPMVDWNRFADYYPGADYVDWLAISVYGKQYQYQDWIPFRSGMDRAYKELAALDPDKPIILAEWGVGEFPKAGSKSQFITDAFTMMKNDYPRVRAEIFWHERWINQDGSTSNLRVHSSPESLETFRTLIADPYWVEKPRLIPR